MHINENKLWPLVLQFTEMLEGFSPTAYTDNYQWSIGYGSFIAPVTEPKPSQVITRLGAFKMALYKYSVLASRLNDQLKRDVTTNEACAMLLFAYNEGSINKKMMANINEHDASLEVEWKLYIYAGGKINQTLVSRRIIEWNIYSST